MASNMDGVGTMEMADTLAKQKCLHVWSRLSQ